MSNIAKHKSSEHSKMMGIVYKELRQYANKLINQEFGGVTFQATELANEVYLKLFDSKNIDWENPKQFMSAAVVVMRRYLVDHARKKAADKRIPKKFQDSLDDIFSLSQPVSQTPI